MFPPPDAPLFQLLPIEQFRSLSGLSFSPPLCGLMPVVTSRLLESFVARIPRRWSCSIALLSCQQSRRCQGNFSYPSAGISHQGYWCSDPESPFGASVIFFSLPSKGWQSALTSSSVFPDVVSSLPTLSLFFDVQAHVSPPPRSTLTDSSKIRPCPFDALHS